MHNAAEGLNCKWFIFIFVAKRLRYINHKQSILNAFKMFQFAENAQIKSKRRRTSQSMKRGHIIKILKWNWLKHLQYSSVIYYCWQKSRPFVVMKLKRHLVWVDVVDKWCHSHSFILWNSVEYTDHFQWNYEYFSP